MKNVFKTAAMVALILSAVPASASGPDKKGGNIEVASPEVFANFADFSQDPVFKRKGDKVLLNMLNLDQKTVIIRVRNADDRVVFEQKVTGESVIQKVFNFNDAFKGDYRIEILDDNQRFEEKVMVM